MSAPRRILLFALLFTLPLIATGCGRQPSGAEDRDREVVEASLRALGMSPAYRFRLEVETWIGVSGYTVYGNEKGEGFVEGGEFSISVLRSSPTGEETITILSQDGLVYSKEGSGVKVIDAGDMPNRLYDPRNFPEVLSGYGTPVSEGEEESGGATFHVYLLALSGDRAQDILSSAAWEYFRNLRYESKCRVWVREASSPPAKLVLELAGYDPQEGLQRLRSQITLTPNPST